MGYPLNLDIIHSPTNQSSGRLSAAADFIDGSDASRRAIGAADCHPLSVPALPRQAIKRLQRTDVPASKLACPSAADPQRR